MYASKLIELLKDVSHEQRIPLTRLRVTITATHEQRADNIATVRYTENLNAVIIDREEPSVT